jgi:hypothetical protein
MTQFSYYIRKDRLKLFYSSVINANMAAMGISEAGEILASLAVMLCSDV